MPKASSCAPVSHTEAVRRYGCGISQSRRIIGLPIRSGLQRRPYRRAGNG